MPEYDLSENAMVSMMQPKYRKVLVEGLDIEFGVSRLLFESGRCERGCIAALKLKMQLAINHDTESALGNIDVYSTMPAS